MEIATHVNDMSLELAIFPDISWLGSLAILDCHMPSGLLDFAICKSC